MASNTGGRILNSRGSTELSRIRTRQSDWCDYSGIVGGKLVGIMLMSDPQNFRQCWYHARDYGFVAANPFGRRAFTDGEESKVVVRRGQSFLLRFGVYFHWSETAEQFDPAAVYDRFLAAAEAQE